MRFHVGFSFRLKHIKKYLKYIILGILTYFALNCFTVNAEEVYTILYGTKATSVNPTSLPVVWNEGVQMVPSAEQLPVYIVNNTGTVFDSYYIRGFNISFSSPVSKTGKSYTIKARFRIKSKGLVYTDNISSVMTPTLVYEQQPDKIKDKSTTYSYYVNDDGSVDFTISSIVNLTESVDLSTIYLSFYNNNSFNGSNYDQWYFMKCWPNELGVCRDTDFYAQLTLLDVETSISEDLNTTLLNGINDSINNLREDINNALNSTNDNLENIEDTITDNSTPNLDNAFSDIELSNDTAISDLITMPINYLNRMLELLGGTCAHYSLDFGIFNSDYVINFDCINMADYFGDYWWNIIDYLICFYMIYNIAMLMITAYEDITTLRDTYGGLYQPRHHSDTRVNRGHEEGLY